VNSFIEELGGLVFWRTLKRRRGYGWHGGCLAAGMTAKRIASGRWLGEFFIL